MKSVGRNRLRLEFGLLYVVLPCGFALLALGDLIWYALPVMAAAAVILLSFTPGFRWRALLYFGAGDLATPLLLFSAALTPVAIALPLLLRPEAFFWIPRHNPELWILILAFYPFLSALPQELMYRALFFERYGALFPGRREAIVANGACFALAHLFLWNLPALLLSLAGGCAFAWAYRERRAFGLAWLMHAIAGGLLFTTGAGVFFYHGAAG